MRAARAAPAARHRHDHRHARWRSGWPTGVPDVVVAPALGISASGEHAGFPGTLSIGTDTTAAVLVELARSADWAAGIVIVNGHGGNADAVDAGRRHDPRRRPQRARRGGRECPDGDAHAGRTETSLMLAIDAEPGRPATGRAGRAAAAAGDRRRAAPPRRACAVSPNGVLGDPTGATLEEGRDLLDMLTDDLVAAVDDARNTW